MVIIIFIIVIIVIIIFIHYLSKNIDNFSNYDITQLNTLDSDLNIYSENINFLSNNNTINSDLLCINGECIDFTEDRNKTLPKPSGEDGVCNDDQCYECTCEHGEAADETCEKKKSESDREQCINCDPGYGLVNGKCVECTGDNYNDEITVNGCKSCSNLKCTSIHYPNGDPHIKRIDCGGDSKGTCKRKICKCGPNGKESYSCTSETEYVCALCNGGYKLTANPGTLGARCEECEPNTYKKYTSMATSCKTCKNCNTTIEKCDDICYEKQNMGNFCNYYMQGVGGYGTSFDCSGCIGNCGEWLKVNKKYRKDCGSTSEGTCNDCPACGAKQYRKDCGNVDNPTFSGTCENCESCPTGQTRIGCKDTSPGICEQNYCNCSNGDPATGSACTSDGANICISCEDTHYLSGNNCVARPTCSTKKYGGKSCSTIMNDWNEVVQFATVNTGDIGVAWRHVMSVTGYSQQELSNILTDCNQLCGG